MFPIRRSSLAALLVCCLIGGCIEEPSSISTFDQVLESTKFSNKLLAPVIVYRLDVSNATKSVLDTLPPQTTRQYTLGKKGLFRHSWKLIPAKDATSAKVGVEPDEDLGVQYPINASYDITNELKSGRTIFTPFIVNSTTFDVRLTANDRAADQMVTNYIVTKRQSIQGAPYFYWNSDSNIRLDAIGGSAYYIYTRNGADTNSFRVLSLDTASAYKGSGNTFSIVVP